MSTSTTREQVKVQNQNLSVVHLLLAAYGKAGPGLGEIAHPPGFVYASPHSLAEHDQALNLAKRLCLNQVQLPGLLTGGRTTEQT